MVCRVLFMNGFSVGKYMDSCIRKLFVQMVEYSQVSIVEGVEGASKYKKNG